MNGIGAYLAKQNGHIKSLKTTGKWLTHSNDKDVEEEKTYGKMSSGKFG